jgi:hypothetical protein
MHRSRHPDPSCTRSARRPPRPPGSVRTAGSALVFALLGLSSASQAGEAYRLKAELAPGPTPQGLQLSGVLRTAPALSADGRFALKAGLFDPSAQSLAKGGPVGCRAPSALLFRDGFEAPD